MILKKMILLKYYLIIYETYFQEDYYHFTLNNTYFVNKTHVCRTNQHINDTQ